MLGWKWFSCSLIVMEEEVTKLFQQCFISDFVEFIVRFEDASKHIDPERLKLLDRIARFQPYGYITTGKNFG